MAYTVADFTDQNRQAVEGFLSFLYSPTNLYTKMAVAPEIATASGLSAGGIYDKSYLQQYFAGAQPGTLLSAVSATTPKWQQQLLAMDTKTPISEVQQELGVHTEVEPMGATPAWLLPVAAAGIAYWLWGR